MAIRFTKIPIHTGLTLRLGGPTLHRGFNAWPLATLAKVISPPGPRRPISDVDVYSLPLPLSHASPSLGPSASSLSPASLTGMGTDSGSRPSCFCTMVPPCYTVSPAAPFRVQSFRCGTCTSLRLAATGTLYACAQSFEIPHSKQRFWPRFNSAVFQSQLEEVSADLA